MAIIANPWAQDAVAFGQSAGNALSQGLLQLPQQRYEMALRNQMMQQAMMKQQQMNQYHQGLLGIRQQGLESQNSARDMANQINLLREQIGQQHEQYLQNRPISLGGGNALIPQGLMPQTNDVGTGQPTQQSLQSPQNFGEYQLMSVPKSQMMTPNEQVRGLIDAGRLYAGALNSTNLNAVDPRFTQTMSNAFYGMSRPQQQQPMTNGLPQQPQGLTNSIPQQGMDTNAIIQQAQMAIQQGADPMAVRQRLQQQYGLGLQ